MSRTFSVLAPLAVLQMATPAPQGMAFMLVPLCGAQAGHSVPIRVPAKNDGQGSLPCCKICHISMRKRSGGDNCCGDDGSGEDDPDVA